LQTKNFTYEREVSPLKNQVQDEDGQNWGEEEVEKNEEPVQEEATEHQNDQVDAQFDDSKANKQYHKPGLVGRKP